MWLLLDPSQRVKEGSLCEGTAHLHELKYLIIVIQRKRMMKNTSLSLIPSSGSKIHSVVIRILFINYPLRFSLEIAFFAEHECRLARQRKISQFLFASFILIKSIENKVFMPFLKLQR